VAGVAAVLAGALDPVGAGGLPGDLLLLPRRLLQGLLGRPALLRRGRTAPELLGRALPAADPPEHPPLFPLPRPGFPGHPGPRRLACPVVRGPSDRRLSLRRGRG